MRLLGDAAGYVYLVFKLHYMCDQCLIRLYMCTNVPCVCCVHVCLMCAAAAHVYMCA